MLSFISNFIVLFVAKFHFRKQEIYEFQNQCPAKTSSSTDGYELFIGKYIYVVLFVYLFNVIHIFI